MQPVQGKSLSRRGRALTGSLVAVVAAIVVPAAAMAIEVKGITTDEALRVVAPPSCGTIKSWHGDTLDIDGRTRSKKHRGLDIVAPRGTPVIAAAPGKVIYRGTKRQGGNSLMVWHGADRQGNRVISYYVHLDEFKVEKDAVVQRGQLLGTLGATGQNMPRSRTPHLHFEVLVYPMDEPLMLFDWLIGFNTVSPNYFMHPLPPDGGANQQKMFPAWTPEVSAATEAGYSDGGKHFTGFTFPLECPVAEVNVAPR